MRTKYFFIIYLFSFFTYYSQTTPVCLEPQPPYTYSVTIDVISHDFNNDGILDLGSCTGSSSFRTRLGIGTGSFSPAMTSFVGFGPQQATAGDFNKDGKLDIAITRLGVNNVTVLLGSGTGTFAVGNSYTVGANPKAIINTDLNNDTNLDIVVGSSTTNSLYVFLGNGTGSFSLNATYSTTNTPESITVSDFNADGNKDIAVAVWGWSFPVLLGTGTGSFTVSNNASVSNDLTSVTSADFNKDGKIDLAFTDGTSNSVNVLFGSGTGTFSAAGSYTVGNYPRSINASDMNGDSNLDIAITCFNSNVLDVLHGTASGTFTTKKTFTTSLSPYLNTIGDFNSDGKPDIAYSYGNAGIGVMLNDLPYISVNSGTICTGQSFTIVPSGANSYTFSGGSSVVSPTINSSYTITGTSLAGCSNTVGVTSNVMVNTCTGVLINENKSGILSYPNPCTTFLYIDFENDLRKPSLIEITDVCGKNILRTRFSHQIDMSELSSGLYYLKVSFENKESVRIKFIKE